jgi:hypothetical protein
MACFSASRKAYSEALADGRLEVILAQNRVGALRNRGIESGY